MKRGIDTEERRVRNVSECVSEVMAEIVRKALENLGNSEEIKSYLRLTKWHKQAKIDVTRK